MSNIYQYGDQFCLVSQWAARLMNNSYQYCRSVLSRKTASHYWLLNDHLYADQFRFVKMLSREVMVVWVQYTDQLCLLRHWDARIDQLLLAADQFCLLRHGVARLVECWSTDASTQISSLSLGAWAEMHMVILSEGGLGLLREGGQGVWAW